MAPLASPIDVSSVDRVHFFTRVDREAPNGCWQWIGPTGAGGYGIYRIERGRGARKFMAHRVSMALHLGGLDSTAVIDHDAPGVGCSNRLCVNPDHLVVTDVRGNNATKEGGKYVAALGLRCQRDHDLTLPNATYPTNGGVGCRECQRMKAKESQRRLAQDPEWRERRNARVRARRAARKAG